ncbi:hypothetical protein [Bdellovibrio sp. HCB-162]|uniref:hypothetical protein n=1 Tax=Bdellovibrio sp. HCB-162 TaxID=3394234 RepID=UPI0039BD4554
MKSFSRFKYLLAGLVIGVVAFGLFNAYRGKEATTVEDLFTENIEHRFYSYATQIVGKQRLQVAKLQETEVFERTSKLKAFWVDLPDVVVKATVPVEYSFFVDMNRGWKFQLVNNEILVDVPGLSNSTPAVDIGKLRFDVVKGSLFRSEKDSLEKIQKELMGLLVEKSIEHRKTVREQARTSLEQFIKGWLSQVTGGLPSEKIKIRFADEPKTENLQ